jgi:ATP-dependent Lon protease
MHATRSGSSVDTVAFDEVSGIKVKDPDAIQIMKDYMANGRFSRGVEVIADASMAFVGNIDQSVEQIVNSTEYDLFVPLPQQFDLAVMDRFACYLPGWEMPKTSSEFLTGHYGLITDYLAEAFHYQLKHSNRYEDVNKRSRLGVSVEGRDEKGIKKTLCAFLKILHPAEQPTDEEFAEYVTYAVECRRRIKEQMNKRKPDDEFARIDLSFIDANGTEIVVYCPESRTASATLEPARRRLEVLAKAQIEPGRQHPGLVASPAISIPAPEVTEPSGTSQALEEQHFSIQYGDIGYTYDAIFGNYLAGAKTVTIEDPYIRAPHQIANFVRFCETVVRASPTIGRINLITGYDDKTDLAMVRDKLEELKQSLLEVDVFLHIQLDERIHDREVRIDNGWTVKIGRGLDFYQKPDGWFAIGASDFGLRKCLETKVDIFKRG